MKSLTIWSGSIRIETATPTKVRTPAISNHIARARLRRQSSATPAVAAPSVNSSVAIAGVSWQDVAHPEGHGGRYILEDGSGRFLFEHQSLALVALHAKAAVQSMRGWLVARAVLLWCTIRHLIHDKVEPLLTEGEELLVELAPQLAAFA